MSFVERPMPDETCGCGAHLHTRSRSLDGIERERATFREAHAECRKPQILVPVYAMRALVRAAIDHGVNAEVGAAIAHLEIYARQQGHTDLRSHPAAQ